MNVTLKRDGLTLRGELLKPDVEKCPILIIFHAKENWICLSGRSPLKI